MIHDKSLMKCDKQGALWPHTARKGVITDWYEVRKTKTQVDDLTIRFIRGIIFSSRETERNSGRKKRKYRQK